MDTSKPIQKWEPIPQFPMLLTVELMDGTGRLVGVRTFTIQEEQLKAMLYPNMNRMTAAELEGVKKAVMNLQVAAAEGAKHVIEQLRKASGL